MTDAQAQRLWDRAIQVPEAGRIVEIGSFQGRSAIVLARAARPSVEIVTIDPHAGSDRGPREIHGDPERGESDHSRYFANLARAGVANRIRHVRQASQAAGDQVEGPIDLLYIDGAHRFRPALADIRSWGRRVADDGVMLIHDAYCSVGVTGAIAADLLSGRRFLYSGRVGSLAEYRQCTAGIAARAWSAVRQLGQIPWFLRNVMVKVLMLMRLHPLTRLLGHRSNTLPPF
ncbi:MAG: class I SAM-dependent methyltransferase [Actinobacteria bacterium]|nr:class I SAM-dependent methyltransferase [Actinomycetota bacterium]